MVADRGFAIARFDNRTGLSTQFSTVGVPNLFTRLTRPTAAAGYRSQDIADDGISVLDALRWDSAHVVGQRTDMQVDPSLSTPRDWRTERLVAGNSDFRSSYRRQLTPGTLWYVAAGGAGNGAATSRSIQGHRLRWVAEKVDAVKRPRMARVRLGARKAGTHPSSTHAGIVRTWNQSRRWGPAPGEAEAGAANARELLAAGQRVVRVPPKLMSRARSSARTRGE